MLKFRKLLKSSRAADKADERPTAHQAVESVRGARGLGAMADGAAHFAAGRFDEALKCVDDGLAHDATDTTLWFARGSTLFAWGRFYEALQAFEQASDAGMQDFDLDMQLGWTNFNLQRFVEAEANFRRAVNCDPDSKDAYVALANVLEVRGMLSASAANFEQGLSRWPENFDATMLLAACRFHQGDRQGGISAFRHATSIDPGRSRGWWNLGVALSDAERVPEALQALRRAYEIDRRNGASECVLNFATVLREDHRHAEALALLENDLVRNPDPREHWLRSVLLLEAGRFVDGWREHEFRWMKEPLVASRITIRRPVWDGQDLYGKTIVLHAEQGLGDAIQFIRYARLLKARGARVIFDAFKDFVEISHDFDGVDEVPVDCPMPEYDYHVPLLSLPRAFGTTVASIPAHVPYVTVRPAHKERWAQRIADSAKLKVGLVWAGNPRHVRDRLRSLSLAQLTCVAGVNGIQLYSLQKGATAAAEIAASGLDIVDLAQDFVDFCDTAAAISHLDLVISVDTSVAHLAGALAKPVWLMIPKPADWRWLLEGDSTPWYPTMRIFRQPERGRWDIIVEDIARSLEQAVQAREQALQSPRDDGSSATTSAAQAAFYSEHGPDVHEIARCGVQEARYGIVQYPPNGLMAQSVRHYGEYRQAELDLLGRFIKPGSWVLEACCGAGAATLFLANAVTATGHIVAYEDDQLLHQLARQNLAANRVRNVTLLRRRLGARPSPVLSDDVNANAGNTDSVDGLRLAQLDWMTINASAAAPAILAGASETLWRLRPWLFVVIEREGQATEIARTARDCGYQAWHHTAPLFSPANYNCRSDNIFPGEHARGLFCIPEEFDVDVNLDGCMPLKV